MSTNTAMVVIIITLFGPYLVRLMSRFVSHASTYVLIDVIKRRRYTWAIPFLLRYGGADPNAFDDDKSVLTLTLLAFCTQEKLLLSTIDTLIEMGVDTFTQDSQGMTSLHWACRFLLPREAVEKIILAFGQLKAPKTSIMKMTTNNFETALFMACDHHHQWDVCVDIASALIMFGADANAPSGLTRCPPLVAVARNHALPLARLLLENGARIDECDLYHRSPLIASVHSVLPGNVEEMVRFLIEHGASSSRVDNEVRTLRRISRAIRTALTHSSVALLQGNTALMYAASRRSVMLDIGALLLSKSLIEDLIAYRRRADQSRVVDVNRLSSKQSEASVDEETRSDDGELDTKRSTLTTRSSAQQRRRGSGDSTVLTPSSRESQSTSVHAMDRFPMCRDWAWLCLNAQDRHVEILEQMLTTRSRTIVSIKVAVLDFVRHSRYRRIRNFALGPDKDVIVVKVLSEMLDSSGRRIMDAATPKVRAALQRRLLFLGRYQIDDGLPTHASETSVVCLGTDYTPQRLYRDVFESCCDRHDTIPTIRHRYTFDVAAAAVGLIRRFDGPDSYDLFAREALAMRKEGLTRAMWISLCSTHLDKGTFVALLACLVECAPLVCTHVRRIFFRWKDSSRGA